MVVGGEFWAGLWALCALYPAHNKRGGFTLYLAERNQRGAPTQAMALRAANVTAMPAKQARSAALAPQLGE